MSFFSSSRRDKNGGKSITSGCCPPRLPYRANELPNAATDGVRRLQRKGCGNIGLSDLQTTAGGECLGERRRGDECGNQNMPWNALNGACWWLDKQTLPVLPEEPRKEVGGAEGGMIGGVADAGEFGICHLRAQFRQTTLRGTRTVHRHCRRGISVKDAEFDARLLRETRHIHGSADRHCRREEIRIADGQIEGRHAAH